MARAKPVRGRPNRRLRGPGPAIARARPAALRRNPLDISPGEHAEFQKKARVVQELLRAQRVRDCSADAAAAWALAFADEADPTFCVLEWVEAGWRDPELVHVALRVCGTRDAAERCLKLADRHVGDRYDRSAILALTTAMQTLRTGIPDND